MTLGKNGAEQIFLERAKKIDEHKQQRKKKTGNLGFKIKSFYASRDIIKKVKRQPKERESVFVNHISGTVLISRIYKEFLKLNNKEVNSPL